MPPIDITPIGHPIIRKNFFKKKFPKSSDNRSFQPQWLAQYNWTEYSESDDAMYCYACRQFGIRSKNQIFVTTGYNHWKMALVKNKGLHKHDTSDTHLTNMSAWKDKENRETQKKDISLLLSADVLEKRRYYVQAIVQTISFLAKNELAFRGTWDTETQHEEGLFNSFFEFMISKDDKLKSCAEMMPQNAKYTSPDVQNEIIATIASMMRDEISSEINSSNYFTILVDGTKDKNGNEIISIAVRYVKSGYVFENLLDFQTCDELNAEATAKVILSTMRTNGLDVNKLISQCYDGASVMSGDKGGVQAVIQRELGRKIPYVHCFNHRLHLVVIHSIERVQMAKFFFGELQLLHNFFSRFKVKQLYEGTAISRLIVTRWTGHLKATQSVLGNYNEIVTTLPQINRNSKYKFDSEDIALATGILAAIKKLKFVFMLHCMKDLLETIEPANRALQAREIGYRQSIPIISETVTQLEEYRTQEKFQQYYSAAATLTGQESNPHVEKSRRVRRRSTLLGDSVVEETLGERSDDMTEIKSAYFDIIDNILSEIKTRFTENDRILLALSSAHEIEPESLKELSSLGLKIPSDAELSIAKKYLSKKKEEKKTPEHFDTLKELYSMQEVFSDTYKLFSAIETFGSSTAVCEASFSRVTRINRVQRMSMTTKRLRELSLIAFESEFLEKISSESILRKFNDKTRRLRLY